MNSADNKLMLRRFDVEYRWGNVVRYTMLKLPATNLERCEVVMNLPDRVQVPTSERPRKYVRDLLEAALIKIRQEKASKEEVCMNAYECPCKGFGYIEQTDGREEKCAEHFEGQLAPWQIETASAEDEERQYAIYTRLMRAAYADFRGRMVDVDAFATFDAAAQRLALDMRRETDIRAKFGPSEVEVCHLLPSDYCAAAQWLCSAWFQSASTSERKSRSTKGKVRVAPFSKDP